MDHFRNRILRNTDRTDTRPVQASKHLVEAGHRCFLRNSSRKVQRFELLLRKASCLRSQKRILEGEGVVESPLRNTRIAEISVWGTSFQEQPQGMVKQFGSPQLGISDDSWHSLLRHPLIDASKYFQSAASGRGRVWIALRRFRAPP